MQRHNHWPVTIHWRRILFVSLGVTFALMTVGLLADLTRHFLLVSSLGASSVLLFGFPDSAFAQPRNFLCGNFICALIGLTFFHVIGATWFSIAVATGLATAAMMISDTLHPPAASLPLLIYTLHSGWSFLLVPNLCGDLLLLGLAILYHRLIRKDRYPHYWI